MEFFDWLRGWMISGVILFAVGYGALHAIFHGRGTYRRELLFAAASFIVCLCGVGVFAVLNFVPGWEEYFAIRDAVSERTTTADDFSGMEYFIALGIEAVGNLGLRGIGIVFGLVGVLAGFVTRAHIRFYFLRLRAPVD